MWRMDFRKTLVVSVLLISACTSKKSDLATPSKVLESYIEQSFNVRTLEDRQQLLKFLTGDTKNRLAAWSDEQFLKAFVESTRKFKRLKILESKKLNEQVLITYELSFDETAKNGPTRVVQKKLCVVVEDAGEWKIQEVRSVRESIEYVDGLSLP
jgi:hypothetical protein